MPDARTLGVEEELHVVDLESGRLTGRAPELLSELPAEGFTSELQRSTVETNTPVVTTLSDLDTEIRRLRHLADTAAADLGLGVVASGTAPSSRADDFELTALGRFSRMQRDYRVLVDEQLICGLQVHVGVADRNVAVRVAQRIAPYLPTLLAMSASSPYWHGSDTGYASYRSMIWQRWPTAGSFGALETAAEYDALVRSLIESGVISDAKMVYFDVRPSAHVPTIELRICDVSPLVEDAVLIAGVFRGLVGAAIEAEGRGEPIPRRSEPIHRAAMWRAARNGLDGTLLTEDLTPTPLVSAEVVRGLVKKLRPQLEETDDWKTVQELGEGLLGRGSSSHRQRGRFAERGQVNDVVRLLLADTRSSTEFVHDPPELTAGYLEVSGDEALGVSGIPRPNYRPLFDLLDELGAEGIAERTELAKTEALRDGFSFGVDGEQRAMPFDLVPRIVSDHEWSVLAAGLTQRARAIEMFLQDIYGPARIIADGRLENVDPRTYPGWRDEATRLPAGVIRSPIIGFDLVYDSLGPWRVLEDNARVPSGIGYAIGMRQLMRSVLPELSGDAALRDPDSALELLGRTMRAAAPGPDRVVALLSDGAGNSAWFEHRMIADGAGFLLVQPEDLEVTDGHVHARGRRVDVLYLRLAVELVDLRTPGGTPIGAQVMAVAQDGNVVLANAPGAGVADDKAMYCMVPDFIGYYLGERPLLSPVPTYRCSDPSERAAVLGRLGELVTKPVDGYGGSGVLVGPAATTAELVERRAEIEATPSGWIAQEVVDLSTHPTLGADGLEPRHVDLRAFVCLTGTGPDDAHLADLALTRVAPEGSMVVNSSRGGGAKDTWIIAGSGSGSGG